MQVLHVEILGNTVLDYAVALGVVLVTLVAARIGRRVLLQRLRKLASSTANRLDDMVAEKVLPPAFSLATIAGFWLAKGHLKIAAPLDLWVDRGLVLLALVVVFLILVRLVQGVTDVSVDAYLARVEESGGPDVAHRRLGLERVRKQVKEVSGMALWMLGILTMLSNLGVDLKAIWASLGIGGIALVVAVKEPLANLVGRLYIYSTGIFDEGHFIVFGPWGGTVTKIGLFRTYMELFSDMTTVSIPNADFVKGAVKSYFGRTRFIYRWDLDVPYDTTPERIAGLLERLRALIRAKPELNPERCWIYLDRLDAHSKVIRVWFQVNLKDWATSLFYGEGILQEIQGIFADEGVAFAFPTQTLHLEAQALLGSSVPASLSPEGPKA